MVILGVVLVVWLLVYAIKGENLALAVLDFLKAVADAILDDD